MSVFISSPVSREQLESVLEHGEHGISTREAASVGSVSVGFHLQLCASLTIRKINRKSDAVSHAFPPLNFGSTFTRALLLQELILMQW